jgi:hypothetical protein
MEVTAPHVAPVVCLLLQTLVNEKRFGVMILENYFNHFRYGKSLEYI